MTPVPAMVWPTTILPVVTALTVRVLSLIVPVNAVAGVLIVYGDAAPAVMVVPGVIPQFGDDSGHEMTCPMAIVPVTDEVVS